MTLADNTLIRICPQCRGTTHEIMDKTVIQRGIVWHSDCWMQAHTTTYDTAPTDPRHGGKLTPDMMAARIAELEGDMEIAKLQLAARVCSECPARLNAGVDDAALRDIAGDLPDTANCRVDAGTLRRAADTIAVMRSALRNIRCRAGYSDSRSQALPAKDVAEIYRIADEALGGG